MSDPIETTRAALSGIKEAVKVGREIKETAREVNTFLDEEAKARVAWKRKQQQMMRRGDMVWMEAIDEYRIIRQIREAEQEMYRQVMQARREWSGIILVSAIVYGILKATGAI